MILACICENGSPSFCYQAIGKSSGKYATLLLPQERPRKDIIGSLGFVYTAFDEASTKFGLEVPQKIGDYFFASKFFDLCRGSLAEGRLKPHPSAR